VTDPLAATITAQQPLDNGMRIGIVESVSPVVITVGGAEVAAGKLGSYQPALGDNVALIRQDSTWLVLGSTNDLQTLKNVILGGNYGKGTGFPVASSGAEAAFPSANWAQEDTISFPPGWLFRLWVQPSPNCAGSSQGSLRVRQGAHSTTGNLLWQGYVQYDALFADIGRSEWHQGLIRNSTANVISTKLSLTVDKDNLTSDLRLYGGDVNAPTVVEVEALGLIRDNPAALGRAIALV
jgi:hypothetical protein